MLIFPPSRTEFPFGVIWIKHFYMLYICIIVTLTGKQCPINLELIKNTVFWSIYAHGCQSHLTQIMHIYKCYSKELEYYRRVQIPKSLQNLLSKPDWSRVTKDLQFSKKKIYRKRNYIMYLFVKQFSYRHDLTKIAP